MFSKQGPKEMYAKFSMATPLWKFDATSMLSIDEIIEAAKAMQTTASGDIVTMSKQMERIPGKVRRMVAPLDWCQVSGGVRKYFTPEPEKFPAKCSVSGPAFGLTGKRLAQTQSGGLSAQ